MQFNPAVKGLPYGYQRVSQEGLENMKGTIVLLLSFCLSACSWFGNGCKGEGCDQSTAVGNPGDGAAWYCYATPAADQWSCGDASNPGQARQSSHQPQQPVQPQQSTQQPQQSTRQPQQSTRQPQQSSQPEVSQGTTSILQQPSGFYTIQLIAVQEEDKILTYALENGMKYPLYTQILSEGQVWYVLLLGLYPDRLTAASARDEWTRNKDLSVKPWIRQLGTLQDAIRSAAKLGMQNSF